MARRPTPPPPASPQRAPLHPHALHAAVSGPFRRAISEIDDVVAELVDRRVTVLSPADPRIVDAFGDFVFVASDRVRHIRSVQERHLHAISAADLLWLVCPDGYVGPSAAMEIGWAARDGTPIFAREVPVDLTMRRWVTVVPSLTDALEAVASPVAATEEAPHGLILDPARAIQASHDDLLVAQRGLTGRPSIIETDDAHRALGRVRRRLLLP